MTSDPYVHGYSPRESVRLGAQAHTLAELLHGDERFPEGSKVLEAGCGTGEQTVILARNNPKVDFVSIDISKDSLDQARGAVEHAGIANVRFEQADLFHLPFANAAFDAVFVCFVLEHLRDPLKALAELQRVLRPGGVLSVIEGDHGSAYFHPDSVLARKTIQCLIDLQRAAGGDSLIGRQLYPLLHRVGMTEIEVSPRVVYADPSRPEMVNGFTRNTFIAMVEGVCEKAVEAGMMSSNSWREGIEALRASAGPEGVFNYTFFKARAEKSGK
jgi:SAM-dependent methyltransferase